jgi:hypothetical protein
MATYVLIHGGGDVAWHWPMNCAPAATTWSRPTCPTRTTRPDCRPPHPDPVATFLHDVPPDLAAEAVRRWRDQSSTPWERPWPLAAWPAVPTRFLLCRDDRVFPAAFLRRVVRERLGIAPDEIDGGHYVALSRPKELADRLEAYRAER